MCLRVSISACDAFALPLVYQVDDTAGLEQFGYEYRGVEVVVESGVAALLEFAYIDSGFGRWLELLQAAIAVEHAFEGFLGALQGFVAEVDCAAVVSLENEESYGHGRVGLLEQGGDCPVKKFVKG